MIATPASGRAVRCSAWLPADSGRFLRLQKRAKAIKAPLPEGAASDDPALGLQQALAIELAGAHPPDLAGGDDPAVLQDLEVLDHRGQAHRQRPRQLRDGGGPAAKLLDERPASAVGEGPEDAVNVGLLKHMLKYCGASRKVKRHGVADRGERGTNRAAGAVGWIDQEEWNWSFSAARLGGRVCSGDSTST